MNTQTMEPAAAEFERLSNGGQTMTAVMTTNPQAMDVGTVNLRGMVVCDERGRFEALVVARPRRDVYRMRVMKFQGNKADFEMVSSVAEALRFGAR